MKAEDMILGNKAKPKIQDGLGNELREGDLVTIQFNRPPVFHVVKAEPGGIQTPHGQTPTVLILQCEITVAGAPKTPMTSLIKIVNPTSEVIMNKIFETKAT